jgi:hypothetical protein
MQLEDFTPGDTILLRQQGVELTATVTAVRSIPDSLGRRHEYVDFTPLPPHQDLVYWYCFPNQVVAKITAAPPTTDNDPED